MDYNKTINLPKTDFPMRAGLPKREPEMLKRWEDMDLYNELLKKNEGKPRFSLHDGPPFSNGSLHMGHALNKSLKDIIVRSYAMRGRYTPYIPGWDNHGMPIESAIIKEQKLNRKAMSVSDFRTACHAYAEKYIGIQMEGFKRLGVVADWEHPYKTMNPSFEAEEVKVFGEMYKKGYIYKGLKPVYWCYHDETALAEAEIEYQDDPCTTVYVKFPMHDDQGKLSHLDKSKLNFVIWTTTIWTLPGNLAIALHPSESYAVVKNNGNGEMYIMAEALTDKVMGVAGISDYEIVETHEGAFFENMLADHPFLPKTSRLVLADYVTMDSGTGCVHTAPGFGADDYQTCKRYGMDMVVPVDDQGRHTDYAGKYEGMLVEESNPVILADMKEAGSLFASEEIVHSYPHCWRCKHPIIFRATEQWFCSIAKFREDVYKAIDTVTWMPDWGHDRMTGMVRDRNDWCISRQRTWGVPIPAFYCKKCGTYHITDATIKAVSDLFRKEGSDSWFIKDVKDIIPAGTKCECGCTEFVKEKDIFDVWFDSGVSHRAVMKERGFDVPVDLYLEGADQYRGWFQSSLLTSVATTGKAPYKAVCTHGWVVDGEGRAMHKSLGNGIDPQDVIKQNGADILRLWVASSDYHSDIRISKDILKQLADTYKKIRNTARYILGNICNGDGFDPDKDMVAPADMKEIDKWAIIRLNALIDKVKAAYDAFDFHVAVHAIHNFCVTEMSNFYLDIIKDRLYCTGEKSPERRSAQSAMYIILSAVARMIAPILSFTAEEIWKHMPHGAADDKESIFFNQMPEKLDVSADDAFTAKWDMIYSVRSSVTKALEMKRAEKFIGASLEAKVTLHADSEALYSKLSAVEDTLAAVFIVSAASVVNNGDGEFKCEDPAFEGKLSFSVEKADGAKCERCWCYSETVGEDHDHPTLCKRCVEQVTKA